MQLMNLESQICTAKLLVPQLSFIEVGIAMEKLISDISLMLAELLQAGCRTLHSKICKPIVHIWNKEELSQHW
jgi:hypothetical protein